ncbi:MAG: DMT family transporter [Proteobacteria bacterium]|nr:DMT family transporter [Pseudomonadota bacterium]MBI3497056.1 DMT family transporter [Pseudomonadota bacterium]
MPSSGPTHTPQHTVEGILLMLGALVLLPTMDAVIKHLSQRLPVGEIIWARYFFHLAVLLPVVLWRHRAAALIAAPILPQLCRGILLLGSTTLFVTSLSMLPMADAASLFFMAPLIIAAAAPRLLRERVGLVRWLAVLLGFVGALIIVRPGFASFQWGSLFALGSAVVNASYLMLTRRLAGSVPPLVALTYVAATGAVLMSLIVPVLWVTPSPRDAALLLAVGLLAALGHFLVIKGLERAPASVLAPCTYFGLVTATILGYLVFGQLPDLWTWIGAALVVTTGLAVTLGEHWQAQHSLQRQAGAA